MNHAGMMAGNEAAAMIAEATKASGVIVSVEPQYFLAIVARNNEPLAVHATGGFFNVKHQYLTSYRGLAFFTKCDTPLPLPSHCELIEAKKIWIPG